MARVVVPEENRSLTEASEIREFLSPFGIWYNDTGRSNSDCLPKRPTSKSWQSSRRRLNPSSSAAASLLPT